MRRSIRSRSVRQVLVLALASAALSAAPAAAFQVTGVTAAVQPAVFNGPCPIAYTLVGTITVDGPGTVTYRWGHSPGTGILESVVFAPGDPLTKTVQRAQTCGGTGMPCDFRELATYSPNQKSAIVGLSGLTCQAFAVTAVVATVTPPTYTGPCPKVFSFTGKITTNGPGTVTYRWAHVPYVMQEQSVAFAAAGTQFVTFDWLAPKSLPVGERWLDLIVSSPNLLMVSPPIAFTMQCLETIKPPKQERVIQKKVPPPPPVLLEPTPPLPPRPQPHPPATLKNAQ